MDTARITFQQVAGYFEKVVFRLALLSCTHKKEIASDPTYGLNTHFIDIIGLFRVFRVFPHLNNRADYMKSIAVGV